MDWLNLLVPPVVGACMAGVVTLLAALVGPGTYRGWRIKKLLDLVKDLDRHQFPGQRAVLLDQVRCLATQMAAIYKVPQEWRLLMVSYLLYGALAGSTFALISLASSASGMFLLLGSIVVVILISVTYVAMKPAQEALNYVKFHRAEFIRRGLPESYELPPRPRPWWFRK
ncbi:hypothetical protein KO481_41930 [Nocardia sp. NEAU-G5]|uniref:DUF2721 domain-containing protein n=1 Tax=Nocardia albiluteola TaxID=2842303 RepID=A0ABS6BD55_9NOCA|nr:hypothetical protein [Nocardia albiluteola]MBU3068063.1 hypothetical protein [Nocardia albiluteola]